MKHPLHLYDTLSKCVKPFVPLHAPHVGLYVCGPTVYDHPHLGHGRSAIVFDTLVRWLRHHGYQVRYVRNITDVGHLTDAGEDKLARKAQVERRHPMEVSTHYTRAYHAALQALHTLPPSLEPLATGHIPEQIALVERLLASGMAYEAEGSVYFDLHAYHARHGYGQLSGAKVEEMVGSGRSLQGQEGKRSPLDFALWKRAAPAHVMRWPSPWGEGFPGWHLECTAMSAKYLGTTFDIHGGGRDLAFPHHECEIAQAQVAHGVPPARYWMHHNMVTLGGQKMSKSTGNFITLAQCFREGHPLLRHLYPPMAFRLLVLQAHYRSVLAISDEALLAATQAYYKLMSAYQSLTSLLATLASDGSSPLQEREHAAEETADHQVEREVREHCHGCTAAMDQDLHTPRLIAHLFQLAKQIERFASHALPLTALSSEGWTLLEQTYHTFIKDILGLCVPSPGGTQGWQRYWEGLLDKYNRAKEQRDYTRVDELREILQRHFHIAVQDTPHGTQWHYRYTS